MIIFGIILLALGFLTGIGILETLGLVIALVGAALWALGNAGHAVGGRRHYW